MCYKQKCKVVSLNLAHHVYLLISLLTIFNWQGMINQPRHISQV